MSLTREQTLEIAAFDGARRTRCGRDGKPTRRTLRYNYIVPDKTSAASRRAGKRPDVKVMHVAVRLDGGFRPVVKDVARWDIATRRLEMRDLEYRMVAGWFVEWRKEDLQGRGKGKGPRAGRPVDGRWWSGGEWCFGSGRTFPWFETVNPGALKGTRYEWCQYRDGLDCRAGLVDWLILYRLDSSVEHLAKAGLYNFIKPGGIAALKDKKVLLRVREMLTGGGRDVREGKFADIVYAARHGIGTGEARKRREFILRVSRVVDYHSGKVKLRLDYDRLRKAFERWRIRAEEYARYLKCAVASGLDCRNEGTLYPPLRGGRKAFMARLESLEAEVAEKERRKAEEHRKAEEKWIRETMEARIGEIKAFQESVERSAVVKGGGYDIVLAKSQKELLAEGKRMGNCVGNGIYGRGIAKGNLLIVMLKQGGKSYCDIEIDRANWMVRQCYLKGNELAPETTRELAGRIAACLKAEHSRHLKRGMFKELLNGYAA